MENPDSCSVLPDSMMMHQSVQQLADQIENVFFTEDLFDAMPDLVFFVKDLQGRYMVVNQTLVQRCGFKSKQDLLGRTALEVFPAHLASNYVAQDQQVFEGKSRLTDQLELHLYPNADPGWCLTQKIPLYDQHKKIIGLSGTSRDLALPKQNHPAYQKIAETVKFMQLNFAENLTMADFEKITRLSATQIERYFQKIFSIKPRQMLIKIRLEQATALLAKTSSSAHGLDPSITEIACACGYQDHSAFSRVFKSTVGMTPTQYRQMLELQSRKGLNMAERC